jgi:hypothetical protein
VDPIQLAKGNTHKEVARIGNTSISTTEVAKPWERYHKIFEATQARPAIIVHAKNPKFTLSIVRKVKADSNVCLLRLSKTTLAKTIHKNIVDLQDASYDMASFSAFMN